ncbi:MAG: hypothetical protein R3212_13215 [Xanthomonadales bacterium]|nr:hypothetical protein [Xanthomonadales bacterium]
MKKIGVLRGMETTFPDGLIPHINDEYGDQGVHAEFVQLDHVSMDGDPEYAVLFDRISHEVPHEVDEKAVEDGGGEGMPTRKAFTRRRVQP